jgi:cytochrome c peroxidase
MKILRYFTILAGAALAFSNCQKENRSDLPYQFQSQSLKLPEQDYNYSKPTMPAHFSGLKGKIEQKVTDAGATLGRVLFYDKKLSLTNNTACASCHLQEKGFADVTAFSRGFDGALTTRNSSAIINPGDDAIFFWDARETNLKTMVTRPIENHIEMGMDNFDALEKKLGTLDYYQTLFENAFGDKQVTKERIAEAMSQFLTSMATTDAEFDRTEPGSWGAGNSIILDDSERRGMHVFFDVARCGNCHNPAASFAQGFNQGFADIGLEEKPTDLGLGARQPGKEGMFKIPSLRNVTLSAPYMHDGRFATLEEVVEHYNSGIQNSPNLDWNLTGNNNMPLRMNLTAEQKTDLIAFLGTLTDQKFISDPKFSNPFSE